MVIAPEVSLHHVRNIRVSTAYPDNSNSLTFHLDGEDGTLLSVIAFGFPDGRMLELLKLLGDHGTRVYGHGSIDGKSEIDTFLETKQVIDAMEGKT